MEFLKISDIDFNNIKFSKSKNRQSKRFILAYYNKKSICVKLSNILVKFNTKMNDYNQIELFLSIPQELTKYFQNLDQVLPSYGEENKWFEGGQFDESEYSYINMLKDDNFIKVKIVPDECIFFDNTNKEIQVNNNEEIFNLLKKNTEIMIGIRCTGVWFIENRYGLSWKAEQIKVINQDTDDSDDDYFVSSDDEDIDPNDEECWLD